MSCTSANARLFLPLQPHLALTRRGGGILSFCWNKGRYLGVPALSWSDLTRSRRAVASQSQSSQEPRVCAGPHGHAMGARRVSFESPKGIVELYVYDLSNGLARAVSQSVVGAALTNPIRSALTNSTWTRHCAQVSR